MPVWTRSLLMAIGRALFWGESHQITEITFVRYTHVHQFQTCVPGTQMFIRYTNQPQPRRAGVHFTGTGNHTTHLISETSFMVIWFMLMSRRSDWIPINPAYGGGLQAQHKTHHPPLRLQVPLKVVLFMTVTMIVRTTMVIVSSCNIALKCGVHTDERTDVHGRHARSVLYPHLC